jgi:hypothetical protein
VAHELEFKGQDVIICMMDTGYRQGHESFSEIINSGRLIAQYDFVNNDFNTDYEAGQDLPNQPNHGTLTWSALGGEHTGDLYGPSYKSHFILSKSEDISSEHHIEEDNWAAAAEWADSIGASVISASLGYRYNFDPPDNSYTYEDMDGNTTIVTIAADLAAYNGIAVATAQGNDGSLGTGSLLAPADGDSVIACGAVDPGRYLAGFSALGPTFDNRIKPEVCAQGVSTACADPDNMNGYRTAGGTSLSTPLVGGACGVLLSAHPNWTPMMVREAMMMTADNAGSPDNSYGWGILDLGRALYYQPDGDVVFNHKPVILSQANESIPIAVTITGGPGVVWANLYYRVNSGDFTEVTMNTSNNILFTAEIPAQSGGELQYYFMTNSADDSKAYNPLGGELHPYKTQIGSDQFTDSFEDGLVYWKTGGDVHNYWGITALDSRTGNISITDSPTGSYANDTDSWFESTFRLNLFERPGGTISFYYRSALQADEDFLYLEASTDQGATWTQFPQAITGNHGSFTEYSASFDDFVGFGDVRLRFHLITSASGSLDGIFIDDIVIALAPVGVDDENENIPYSFKLNQNYPNPFNPSTQISFELDIESSVDLIVYDLMGRKVQTLISGELPAGNYEVEWNGKNDSGDEVSSGIYLYKLESENRKEVRKMSLLR